MALERALDDLGLEAPGEEGGPADDLWDDEQPSADLLEGNTEQEDVPARARKKRHPLLEAAMDLLKHLHTVFRNADERFAPSLHTLFQGAGDAMGGLAQALPRRGEEDDPDYYGLCVTQLKRALRGVAFARGAIFSLRSAVTDEQFAELHRRLEQMEKDIFRELGRLRSEHQASDP
jgi:hypothetical protein